MARPLRVEYSNALYHIVARGNASQEIFLNDKDRKMFLYWLKDVSQFHNIICHAYCLMDNHYHLLIETPEANLSRAIRDLNGNYSQWFNTHHTRIGHLFQGRYKAYLIEKETYLLEVARYIVLNPVRAGMVDKPKNYKWSSYNPTAGITKTPDWLQKDWLLSNFSKNKKIAQMEYRRFVKDGFTHQNPYKDVQNSFILGSPQFVHWIWEKTNGSEEQKEFPREERIVGRPSLEEIFNHITTKQERNEAIIFARLRCGYLTTEIGKHIGLDRAVVGRISRGTHNIKKSKKSP